MPENQTSYDNEDNLPSHSLTYEDVIELLPIFVLGALEPDEMLAVDSYINRHQALADRLAQLEATAAQLAYAAPSTELPGHVKTQLMQRVEADLIAQQPAPLSPSAIFPPRRKTGAAASVVIPPPAPPRKQATNWFGLIARTLIGVGVAAAMFLLVIRMIQLRSTTNLLTTQLAELQAQNSNLQTINQSLEQKLQEQTTHMVALRNDFNMLARADHMISLKGTPKSPTSTGAFYIGNDATGNNEGVLVVSNLQPLPTTQTYQFWLIPADGPPLSAGLIQVADITAGSLTVKIPAQNRNFAKVGLSIEPSGGSRAPTGDIVLLS